MICYTVCKCGELCSSNSGAKDRQRCIPRRFFLQNKRFMHYLRIHQTDFHQIFTLWIYGRYFTVNYTFDPFFSVAQGTFAIATYFTVKMGEISRIALIFLNGVE